MANSCMLFSTSQSRSQSPRSSWSAPTNERLQVHCVLLKKTIALPEVNIQFQICLTIRIAQHKYLLSSTTSHGHPSLDQVISHWGFWLPTARAKHILKNILAQRTLLPATRELRKYLHFFTLRSEFSHYSESLLTYHYHGRLVISCPIIH